MIVLAFVACLDAEPDQCREYNLMFSENITPMRCLMAAQPQLAMWTETHPGWTIDSWRCGRPNQFATKV
jgi:hypothetical protein